MGLTSPINQFNRIAGVYDFLAKLVFGNSIVASQRAFLRLVAGRRVLIVGGGTGWIAKACIEHGAAGIRYVDASDEMIRLTKERLRGIDRDVEYVHGSHTDLSPELTCDMLITNFVLDTFSQASIDDEIARLKMHLESGGYWIATDFINVRSWHRWLLRAMYLFFRMTTGLGARELPDWRAALDRAGMVRLDSRRYCKGFIEARVGVSP